MARKAMTVKITILFKANKHIRQVKLNQNIMKFTINKCILFLEVYSKAHNKFNNNSPS